MTASWQLVVAEPARRAVDRLPTKVAIAVLDFLLGPLLANPERVSKPLRGELAGLHSARVGTYRVVYEINHDDRVVRVVYIDHRADVYRSR
jgi:mRNA-degrading endonuclease RelE of RelBE toxin-antitoxin system